VIDPDTDEPSDLNSIKSDPDDHSQIHFEVRDDNIAKGQPVNVMNEGGHSTL